MATQDIALELTKLIIELEQNPNSGSIQAKRLCTQDAKSYVLELYLDCLSALDSNANFAE